MSEASSFILSSVVILQTAADSGWTESTTNQRQGTDGPEVNVDNALEDFRSWINQRATQFPSFDHAILFTGYVLIFI